MAAWAAFLAYAANQERLSSSAMRRVLSDLRENEDVRSVLGDAVRPEPAWYLNGNPWVYGSVRGAPLSPAYTPKCINPCPSHPPRPTYVVSEQKGGCGTIRKEGEGA